MSKPILYWVDDQAMFYNIVTTLCPKEVELRAYYGDGSLKDFLRELPNIRTAYQQQDVYFLLDVQMPVPKQLANAPVWGTRSIHRDHACGIALAHYLHQEIGLKAERVRLLSAFTGLTSNELSAFNQADFQLLPEMLWGKNKLSNQKLREWMDDALRGEINHVK